MKFTVGRKTFVLSIEPEWTNLHSIEWGWDEKIHLKEFYEIYFSSSNMILKLSEYSNDLTMRILWCIITCKTSMTSRAPFKAFQLFPKEKNFV